MATTDQEGVSVSPVFPWSLRFEPTGEFEYPDDYDVPFETYLAEIPTGSTLFNVYAMDAPVELGGTESLIASMVTGSSMVTSLWGDEHMFFRHERMENDLLIKEEWRPFTPVFKVFNSSGNLILADGTESSCPFAYLFQ